MILEDGHLRAELRPGAGGTVVSLRHRGTGAEVLARVPWEPVAAPPEGVADEAAWLERWEGGWPVLFPNGGDAGPHAGVEHGFHGEASVGAWEAARDGAALVLSRRFASVPARMTRQLSLEGGALVLDAEVVAEAPCEAIWGEHVTLGGDLLAGPVRIATSAARVVASADYDPPESPLRPGAEGAWPVLPGRAGPVDLSRPGEGWSLVAGLMDPGPEPWAEVAREGGPRVRVEWSGDPWPLAWLWVETGGDRAPPWSGRGRCLGIEPCTTWPHTGLARAPAAGGHLLSLRPGEPRRARLAIHVT